MGFSKWIDLPPIWLALFCAVAWWQPRLFAVGSFGNGWADFIGGLLVGAGLVLIALAVVEFRKHKTTVIPHQYASAIITTGIFSRSRNPIYLGDALIFAGLVLRWDAVLSLVLVPVFFWVIENRFIIAEEERLRETFGPAFDTYAAKTRRWL